MTLLIKTVDDFRKALSQVIFAVSPSETRLELAGEALPPEMADKLHYGLAWAYLKEGEFKSAIEEFRKIASQSQDKIVKIAALCQVGDAFQELYHLSDGAVAVKIAEV